MLIYTFLILLKEYFLWVLKTSGAISFRQITVDEKTLHTRLGEVARNLNEFFAIMTTVTVSEAIVFYPRSSARKSL